MQEFFNTCPPEIVPRPVLGLLRGMWVAAKTKEGRRQFGTEILFHKATKHYREGCGYKSERTVRYNLRRSRDGGFLEVAHWDASHERCHHIWIRPRTDRDKGLYRRVTTYRLPMTLLVKWRDWHRNGAKPLAAVAEMPSRKPSQTAAPTATTAPTRSAAKSPQYATLTRRQVPGFVMAFSDLRKAKPAIEAPTGAPANNSWSEILRVLEGAMNVHTFDTWFRPTRYSHEENGVLYVRVPTPEFQHLAEKFVEPIRSAINQLSLVVADVRFVAPASTRLSQEEALVKACAAFGISPEHGEDVLRLHHRWDQAGESPPS